MPSFEEILNMTPSQLKAPPAYPVGTYHCLIEGPLEHDKSSQKQVDFYRAKFKILAVMKDVNAEAAAEQQVIGKYIFNDYYINESNTQTWRLMDMLVDACGIEGKDASGKERPLKELIPEAQGKQLLVKLKHENSQDGKRVVHRVDSVAHV